MRQRCLLLVLGTALSAQAIVALPTAFADVSDGGKTRTTLDWFVPSAPTVTVEDIEEHDARLGRLLEERSRETERRARESERMTQACFDAPAVGQVRSNPAATGSPPARPTVAKPAGASAAPSGKPEPTVEDLMRRYQETRDPADAAAVQQRLLLGGAKVQAPATSATDTLERLGKAPGVDPRMAEQMRRSARATDPNVQACLAEADRYGEEKEPEVTVDYLTPGPAKLKFLKEGRAESLVYERVSGTEVAYYRVNVVLRDSSRGSLAVPMATAMQRSYVGGSPVVPPEADARDREILSNPDSTAKRPKSNAGSLSGFKDAAERLKDALKGVPR